MRSFPKLETVVGLWLVVAIWWSSDGGVAILEFLCVIYGGIALLTAALFLLLFERHREVQLPKRAFITCCGLIVTGWLLFFSPVPFRIRFELSANALERFAAELPVGHSETRATRHVGVFQISESEVLQDHTVRLILAKDMFNDSGVALAPQKPPLVGEDQYEHIRGKWWRWYRRW